MDVWIRLLFVGGALIASQAASQQVATPEQIGSLAGTVSDGDSGALPGVTIVAVMGDRQHIAVTNSSGRYRIERLPAGKYTVGASLIGFATRRGEVQVAAGRQATWNAVLGIRSSFSREPSSGIDPTNPALARGVYEVLLRRVYKGTIPASPIVLATSLIQPFDELEWPRQLAGVPVTLQKASNAAEALRPVTLRAEAFPPGARLVQSITPVDMPYTAFSRVFASDDGLGALVVFTHVCGNLCAESTVVWLRRESLSAPWIVRASHTFMVSAP